MTEEVYYLAIFYLAQIQIAAKNTMLIKDCQLVEINGAF
jgi:hypothetical protein